MKKFAISCLLFVFLSGLTLQAQDLQPPQSSTSERRKRSDTADFLIRISLGATLGGLKAFCDKYGKCPFAIVDNVPIATLPPEGTEDYRRQLSPSASTLNGTTTSNLYRTFKNGDLIAIGPANQYVHDAEKGTYDLLNGVWVYPAKRNNTGLNEEMRQLMDGLIKTNPYISFRNGGDSYVGGNTCLANNYSGVNPRTSNTESVVAYVCQKGEHKLYFVTVASGPDRERYERENQAVIQKITVQ